MAKREMEVSEAKRAREEVVEGIVDASVKSERVRWIEDEVEELERWDGLE